MLVQAAAHENLLQRVQNLFLRMYAWQTRIGSIEQSHHLFNEILQNSDALFEAPLLLYNMDGKLVSSSQVGAVSPLVERFERHEDEIIASVFLVSKSPLVFGDESEPLYIMHRLIHTENEQLYYLLALYDEEPQAGSKDLLSLLAQSILEKIGKQAMPANISRSSFYALFDDLVHRRYVSKNYLDTYASIYRFSVESEFRLVCFKQSTSGDAAAAPNKLMNLVRKMNNGKCLTAVYNEDLYALLWSNDLDSSLSTQAIEEDLDDIDGMLNGFVAVSQVFDNIRSLCFAYQQIGLIESYKRLVDIELAFTADSPSTEKLLYTFEEVFMFALLDSDIMTQEMKDFCFTHTILEKIMSEDIANGDEDVRILATYLRHERKATIVAEKLHMHRNTVLYRIDKIEKRFGLDFDKEWPRNRVMMDLSILYLKLMRNPDLFAELIGTKRQDD